MVRPFVREGKIFIVTDATVRRLYGRSLLDAFDQAGFESLMIDFPAGEKSKNSTVLGLLQTAMLEGQVRRSSVVLALGGGVVGDIAGFAAATVLRGIRFIQVPTTLLAQLDSSVGGKVGIDHPAGKNLLGAFHQPAAVYIDPTVLRTLPDVEFRNGLAEAVKIAVALDAVFFRWFEKHVGKLARRETKSVSDMIERAVGLKALVVQKDEREGGLRQSLNLGHTIGHALEASTGFTLRHGFAVAMGIVAEAKIALRLGYLAPGQLRRIVSLLARLHLPIRIPPVNRSQFLDALSADKKNVGSNWRFTLPSGIGMCALGVEVPIETVEEATGIRG
jgi:3-dehydroquinate synthase